MFPNSEIVKNSSCGRDKMGPGTTWNCATQQILIDESRSFKDFIVMFDKSLNNTSGAKQMDVHVRFWSVESVTSQYLTSEFKGHATAEDINSHFKAGDFN